MPDLPQGTVTFLFTDIEGSTKLVHELGPDYRELLETHQRLLRQAFASGVEIGTEGDSFFVAFDSGTRAVAAAVAGQLALAAAKWPGGHSIRVRMGLHTGEPTLGGDSYVGFDVHRAARIAATGHGGQVLLSESTYALAGRELRDGVVARDLGEHRLKDLTDPERIYQLVIPGLPAEFPPLRTLDQHRTNLPAQLTSFVGREQEVGELRALVEADRLVTVIGAGGTGKTRLALQVAGEVVDHHADGVWLVELAPITVADLLAQEVARTLGIQDEPGRSITDSLLDFIRLKHLLLVLDNCEHLIAAVAHLVAVLFKGAPSLAVLATSREALGIGGEKVYPVPSMRVPPAVAVGSDDHEAGDDWLAAMAGAESVRLFVERAGAVEPSFSLRADNAAAIGEICRRLDGIPLAIELAAARVTLLSVQDIAERLGDRFRLLTGGSRTALPRQQTLQALIDWSWDLLEEPDRTLLRRHSVFIGGATLDAATAITGGSEMGTLEGIGRLVDRSLVIADRGSPTRYRMLETIRQYGHARLVAAGEVAALRDSHLRFYLELAERADSELRGPAMKVWLELLDADAENLRSALDWAFETDATSAMRLCVSMAIYWRTRSIVEGFDRLAQAVDLIARADESKGGSGTGAGLRARVLAAAANLAWLTGNAAAGLPWAERSVKLSEGADDLTARYEALVTLAMTRMFSGASEDVVDMTAEAMRLAEAAGDWFNVAFTEAGLAQGDAENGDLESAEQRLRRGAEAAARSGNPSVIAFSALAHGRVAGFSGRLAEARGAFDRAISGYAQMGDVRLELVTRSDFAHALRIAGEIEEAEPIYRGTLHAWLHAGNRGAIANQLESFALIAMARDQLPRAARLFGAAEAIRETASAPMLPYERSEYDAAVARLHEQLDGGVLEGESAEGRRLTIDEAVAFALG